MAASTTRVVRTRHGFMIAFRNDLFITPTLDNYGEYSPGEWRLLKQIVEPGMTVVEAGANIGTITIPLARHCSPGPLYAFEPQPRIFQILCANAAINDLDNVIARQEAVGQERGEAAMPHVNFAQATNTGGGALAAKGEVGDPVRVVSIDGLNLAALGLLKIDVEGFEAHVLRGARETIARCRPVIYTENAIAEHQAEVIEILDEYGYRLYWHVPPIAEAEDKSPAGQELWGQVVYSSNLLALPKESNRRCDLPPLDPTNWEPPFRPPAG